MLTDAAGNSAGKSAGNGRGAQQPGHRLGCVAVPVIAADLTGTLEEMFRLWSDDRFAPHRNAPAPQQARPQLMVVVNNADAGQLADAVAVMRGFPRLADSFAGLSVHSADLTGDRDLYARQPGHPGGEYGTRAGPNFLFHETMRRAARFGGFTLQVEQDCLPLGPGWIAAVEAVIARNAGAWVIGSVYSGRGRLEPALQAHLNGNALYCTGDPGFAAFLDRVWMPRLLEHARIRRDLAYDCWWALECALANARTANYSWSLLQTFGGFFHADPFVVNLMCGAEQAQDYIHIHDRFAGLDRRPLFFHGPAMPQLRRLLLDHAEDDVFAAIARLAPAGAPAPRRAAAAEPGAGQGAGQGVGRGPDQSADLGADRGVEADDRLRLRQAAARLLLAPDVSPVRGDGDGARALRAARARLDSADSAAAHFDRVMRGLTAGL